MILKAKSSLGPALTFFNNAPVIAFISSTDSQLTLTNPANEIIPVTLIGPPGSSGRIPVICTARPSIIASGKWLLIAWADTFGRVNIAGSSDGKVFGDVMTFPTLLCKPGTGPCLGSVVNHVTTFVEIALFWIGINQPHPIHYSVGEFNSRVPWSPVATLSDTSTDTPGISSLQQNPSAAEVVTASTFLAWSGTDGRGTLTFEQVSVPGGPGSQRHVYDNSQNGGQDVSPVGPAVAAFPNGGPITLAYTGNDNHFRSISSLNPPPLPQSTRNADSRVRQDYADTSFVSPAIAYDDRGSLFWAWTGTDGPPGSLNFQSDASMSKSTL